MSLAGGLFFILWEGGGYIFGKEGNKGFEKPVEALLLCDFNFAQPMSSMPFVNVVSNVHGRGLFKF